MAAFFEYSDRLVQPFRLFRVDPQLLVIIMMSLTLYSNREIIIQDFAISLRVPRILHPYTQTKGNFPLEQIGEWMLFSIHQPLQALHNLQYRILGLQAINFPFSEMPNTY